jgi:hypothetical protein
MKDMFGVQQQEKEEPSISSCTVKYLDCDPDKRPKDTTETIIPKTTEERISRKYPEGKTRDTSINGIMVVMLMGTLGTFLLAYPNNNLQYFMGLILSSITIPFLFYFMPLPE